jgi:hypothetical protein
MHPMPKGLPHATSYTYMTWIRLHLGNTLDLRGINPIGHLETLSKPKFVKLHNLFEHVFGVMGV